MSLILGEEICLYKYVSLAAVALLVLSLIFGLTYAWFSGQSSASADGLLMAGHVDLQLAVDTYSVKLTEETNASGEKVIIRNIVEGTETSKGGAPFVIYPGDVVDEHGNPVKNVRSVIDVAITNTSGTNIIASTNWKGFSITKLEKQLQTAYFYLAINQLLGYSRQNSADDDLYDPSFPLPDEPTAQLDDSWFFFDFDPQNKIAKFVDLSLLNGNPDSSAPKFLSFPTRQQSDLVYHLDAIADWRKTSEYPDGTPYYDKTRLADLMAKDSRRQTGLNMFIRYETRGIPSKENKLVQKYSYFHGLDFATIPDISGDKAQDQTYIIMPPGLTLSIRIELFTSKDISDPNESSSSAPIMNNNYQYAVYALNVADMQAAQNKQRDNIQMRAYGTQVNKEAVDSFFGSGVADQLPPEWFTIYD
jgi:hypothetical protein